MTPEPATSNQQPATPTLYLVATPIGNLGDMTLRAIETLRAVDLIASEDTRKTGHLLHHFGINKPQVAFHEYNEQGAAQRILGVLEDGRSVAVVTNAGTPGIADPGFSLVRLAVEHDIAVTMIPGATAFVMALILSGLPAHSFVFRGFTPHKPIQRRKYYAADRELPYTLIYYESPYRIAASLADALVVLGDRPAALANDLTKLFERVWRGRLSEIIAELEGGKLQGEFVLCVAGVGVDTPTPSEQEAGEED